MQVFFKSNGAHAADLLKVCQRRTACSGATVATYGSNAPPRLRPDFKDSDHRHDHGDQSGSHGQRKKSWLKDVFD